jgi:hypothetical protein
VPAPRKAEHPARVLEILAVLSPLSSVRPVTIDEVHNVAFFPTGRSLMLPHIGNAGSISHKSDPYLIQAFSQGCLAIC